MVIRTAPGVTQELLPSGHLELVCTFTGRHMRCDPSQAAMWIALMQHAGRLDRAAEMLAGIWDADPVDTRTEMVIWAGGLCDAGLLRAE